ncbi:MAG: AarF/ABC1/UbiB kinase family protein [Armatimonadetes bacterium]|nr:AarF/ABC1/UbiB kinase family protein [Armatimonadota bacterium]
MILNKGRKHLRRYREIASVLARHGWGWLLVKLRFRDRLSCHADLSEREHGPAHIREMLEELGPTFVKFGQLLSTRPDIVPESYISELTKLQDTASTVPAEEILTAVEAEFGRPVQEVYREFDSTPFAAASLGQVHRAVLPDGTAVIVKVQRPGIADLIETDIEILTKRAALLEDHWDRAKTYGIADLVDEFAITIREELDYTREAHNTDMLREQLANEKGIKLPGVYWELTTQRLLTLEEIHGVKITEYSRHPDPPAQPAQLAERLASAFLNQIFVHGFFHADPHPGNILVTPEGEIGLVDCGMVGRLDAENRAGAIRMLMAFEQQDTRVIADEIVNLGISSGEVDMRRFTQDLGKVTRGYYDMPGRSIQMGQLLTRALNVSVDHKIRLPASYAVLAKVLTSVDGICTQLDPDFNFTTAARSQLGRAMRSELHSENLLNELYRALSASRALVFSLPEHLERIIRKVIEGTLRVEFKHQGLEDVEATFARSANRVAIALIVAGSIVGSSVVVSAGKGSQSWFGLPALGVLGYIVATIFGVWLIISILKSGRRP